MFGSGLFGNNNTTNNAGGGGGSLFGAPQNQPLITPQNINPSINGNSNQNQAWGSTTTSAFGSINPPNNNGTGLFGTGGAQTNTVFGTGGGGGLLGQNNNQPNNLVKTNSIFGGTSTPNQQPGLFGGTGAFGATQSANPSTGGGLFGQGNNVIGGGFGQPQTNQTPFGGTQGGLQQQNQGLFGQTTTGTFGQTQQQPTGSLFGGVTTQNNQTGMFGTQNQNSQQNQGMFANAQPNLSTNQNSGFGMFQQPQNNQSLTNGGMFGQTAGGSLFGQQDANKGTSWGVGGVIPLGQSNLINKKFVPVKSKNSKVDNKHTVKCITGLDQNFGFSKNQLRIRYIMTGETSGGVTAINQPLVGQSNTLSWGSTTNPATSNFGFNNKTGISFGGNNTTTPFSGIGTLVGGGSFGTQDQSKGLFNGGFATNTTNQGGSFLGNNTNTNTNTNNNNNNNTLFGGTTATNTTGGIFGGNQTQGWASPTGKTSLFNTTAPNTSTGGGLFNQTPTNTAGLFGGNTNNNATSLFPNNNNNNNNMQPNNNNNTSLFGSFGCFPPNNQSQMNNTFPQPNINNQNDFMRATSTLFQTSYNNNNLNQALTNMSNPGNFMQFAPEQSNYPYPPSQQPPMNELLSLLGPLLNQHANPNNVLDKVLQKTALEELLEKLEQEKYKNNQPEQQLKYSSTPSLKEALFDFKVPKIPKFTQNNFILNSNTKKSVPEVRFVEEEHTYAPFPTNTKKSSIKTKFNNRNSQLISDQNLPKINTEYHVKPSLQDMKMMSPTQLSMLNNFTVSNSYGSIKFLEPVNLYCKDLTDAFIIQQDSIQIKDSELENKNCELTYQNFNNFTELTPKDQTTTQKKMKKWINKMKMKLVDFQLSSGRLTVKI